MGRPKKNPGQEGPGTISVKMNSMTMKKARVLADSMKMPLSDFLDGIVQPAVDSMIESLKASLNERIRVQDQTQPDWRDRLVNLLGDFQAKGINYVDHLSQRASSPDLDDQSRAKIADMLRDIMDLHELYLGEAMLRNIEQGGSYSDADELLAQDLERQLYGDKGKKE